MRRCTLTSRTDNGQRSNDCGQTVIWLSRRGLGEVIPIAGSSKLDRSTDYKDLLSKTQPLGVVNWSTTRALVFALSSPTMGHAQ
jgi:hypothetical protein